jgi:tetratricopeptide (TPR) repeat protein
MLILLDKPEKRREALDEAAKCVEIAAVLAPDSWHTHATRAFAFGLRGDLDDSGREFQAAITANRLMTEGHPGYLLFRIAELGAASGDLLESRAVELMGNPAAQAMHGRMLELAGRSDEAEIYYKEALALDPNAGLCHLGLSFFYEKQGRADEASVHAKRAEVLMAPADYRAWQALAEYYK